MPETQLIFLLVAFLVLGDVFKVRYGNILQKGSVQNIK